MRGRSLALTSALALSTACLDAPAQGEVAPEAAGECRSAGQLFDEFDQEEPSDVWQEFGAENCDLRIASGRLELDTAASCGLATAGCYDLSDRWVQVDAAAPGPGLVFAVHLNDFGDDMIIAVDPDGALAMQHVDPDGVATTLTSLPFDPEVHQVWRLWHSASENEIYFETSRRSAPAWSRLAELWLDAVSVREVQVRLGASRTGSMVAFDSLHGVDL